MLSMAFGFAGRKMDGFRQGMFTSDVTRQNTEQA
jgi:hypothetical protein